VLSLQTEELNDAAVLTILVQHFLLIVNQDFFELKDTAGKKISREAREEKQG
jgi:hypothetical protein